MSQKYSTITLAPFRCSHLSVNEMIKVILFCLIPHIILLTVSSGFQALQLPFTILLAAIFSEVLYRTLFKKTIRIGWSTILQGVLIGLLVPSDYLTIAAFIITFLVLFIEKVIYSSFAQSWINSVVLTAVILYFVSPMYYPNFLLPPESVQQTNVGMKLFSDGLLTVARYDARITNFLNTSIFNYIGLSVPEGYITLFWDSQSPIPAFRFNAITLLTSTALFLSKTIDIIIPTVFLLAYSFLVYMFSLYPYAEIVGNGDILLALFTGGTLYSAFFLLGWFGTIPLTVTGKILYALCAGILSFLICGAGTSTIGILFVILILNIVCPIILQIETKFYVSKIRKINTLMQEVQR